MRTRFLLAVSVAGSILLAFGAQSVLARHRAAPSRTFEHLRLHVEVDLPTSRAQLMRLDAHSFLDLPAEVELSARVDGGLARLELFDPAGRSTVVIDSPTSAAFGLSELKYEGAAVSLRELLRQFEPGAYRAMGKTLDGAEVEGWANLRIEFPGPFAVTTPTEVPRSKDGVVIEWTPSRGAVEYRFEIESDAAGFSFEQTLPAHRTSITLPPGLLQNGEAYEYSLSVKGDTDNELEIEGSISIRGSSR